MFKNVFLKLQFTVRKARICLRTFYWSSASPLGKRGPRVRPAALICPESTRGKNPCFFPLAAPLFPSATVGPRSHLKMGPAAGRRTKARPKRLNGLFLFAQVYFGPLDGPDSAHGRQKDATKTRIQWDKFTDSELASRYTAISPFISLGSRRSRACCNKTICFANPFIFEMIGSIASPNAITHSSLGITIGMLLKSFHRV